MTANALFRTLLLLLLISPLLVIAAIDELPPISEQQDASFFQQQNMNSMLFPNNMGGYPPRFGSHISQFPRTDNSMVNFDFRCKCTAKTGSRGSNPTPGTPLPAEANAQAQQQIQQLQNQLRDQQDQLKRMQQQSSNTPFEQFAHMLSVADGLDCSCSGNTMPYNDFGLSNTPTAPNMNMPRVGGLPMTSPFQTRMTPISEFGPQMFP